MNDFWTCTLILAGTTCLCLAERIIRDLIAWTREHRATLPEPVAPTIAELNQDIIFDETHLWQWHTENQLEFLHALTKHADGVHVWSNADEEGPQ